MKFFTPDRIERFGSDGDRIALAAHTEFEQLRLRFQDFDFATLKPIETTPVLAEAER